MRIDFDVKLIDHALRDSLLGSLVCLLGCSVSVRVMGHMLVLWCVCQALVCVLGCVRARGGNVRMV